MYLLPSLSIKNTARRVPKAFVNARGRFKIIAYNLLSELRLAISIPVPRIIVGP
jgi:hypothetical protein